MDMEKHSNTNGNNLTDCTDDKNRNDNENASAALCIEVTEVCESKNTIDEENDEENEHSLTIETSKAKAPDGGWGWCIVLGTLLLRTVIGGFGRSHGLFFLKFKERFNGTATTTALVTSTTGFVRLSTGPIVSILSGRFQSRVLTGIGAVLHFVAAIMTAFSPSLGFLYFSYGVTAGLGRALILTPCPILLGYYFDKRRSLAFGIASAGFSIGGFAITPLVELLFQEYGYQGAFLILSALSLNVLVSSGLFRPIEVHRKLMAMKSRNTSSVFETDIKGNDNGELQGKTLGHFESGAEISSSTFSINKSPTSKRINKKSSLCIKDTKDLEKIVSETNNLTSNEDEEQQKQLLLNDINKSVNATLTKKSFCSKLKLYCCGQKDIADKDTKKNNFISWSILKDVRFVSFIFAQFCFTLPASGVFLPALVKTKGCTDIQAATLLSISAGCDTVFRVISGIILDLKVFRNIRPQVFNGVTFLQASVIFLYPFVNRFHEYVILCALEGAFTGIKMAQGSVIMMDMCGVDKLASSIAVSMSVQCIAVVMGPTLSGLLIDNYGTYNGAFFFASGAVFLGGVVMAAGHVYKEVTHRRQKRHDMSTDTKSDTKT